MLLSFRPGLNLRNVNNSVGSKLEDFFLFAPGFSSLRSLRSLHDITKPAFGVQRVGLHSPMAYLTLRSPQSGSPSLLAPRILQHPRWSKLFRPPRPPPKCKHCRSGRNDFSTKQMDPKTMVGVPFEILGIAHSFYWVNCNCNFSMLIWFSLAYQASPRRYILI